MVHYGGDSGVPEITRKGTLYFYNNTVAVRADQGGPNARYRTALFDATSSDETIDARNNVIVVRPATRVRNRPLTWMRDEGNLKLGVNWASPGMFQWRDDKAPAKGGITGLDKVIGKGSNAPCSRTRPAATSPSRPSRRPVRPRRCTRYRSLSRPPWTSSTCTRRRAGRGDRR